MAISPLAGKKAPVEILVNIPKLISAYYIIKPDPENPANLVEFGTSGHRGLSMNGSFNEAHILAITQAICEYRKNKNTTGPAIPRHGYSRTFRASSFNGLLRCWPQMALMS